MSYSSIVPYMAAVIRVQARSMIFATCGIFTVYTTANCVARARCAATRIRLPTITP